MAKPPPRGYERHPHDLNLIRKLPPPSASEAMYGYLKSDAAQRFERIAPLKAVLGRGLIADDRRSFVSPLGGQAKPAPQPKGKR
jgi:hypothetical protein